MSSCHGVVLSMTNVAYANNEECHVRWEFGTNYGAVGSGLEKVGPDAGHLKSGEVTMEHMYVTSSHHEEQEIGGGP